MKVSEIIDAMAPIVARRGLFIVEVKVSRDNDVTLTVESSKALVTLDDCEALNRSFTSIFDQEVEDYSLTVTSAGLDGEFKVPAQYEKALGSKVEIWLKGGKKQLAVLQSYDDGAIRTDCGDFAMKDINKVKYYIEF